MIKRASSSPFPLGLRAAALLALLLLLPGFTPATAQAEGQATLSGLESDQFPEMRFFFEAHDAQGRFASNLQPAQVRVLEDGQALPVTSLEKQEPGLQLIVALEASPLLLATQPAGVAYFDQVCTALKDWAEALPAGGPDDFSLATNTGLMAIRANEPAKLVEAIDDYQPDLLQTQAGSLSLSAALDLATDPNPRPQMKRVILYITPPPVEAVKAALPSMISRANQLNTHIFVWLVAPANQAGSPEVEALRPLADSTGGLFYQLSGEESPPDINEYLEPLRFIYRAGYRSQASGSGAHRLRVQVDTPQFRAASNEKAFTLQVLPPNPIFLSPPVQVQRNWQEAASRDEEAVLEPQETEIQILVEFPDGHPRELKAARLYVDGALAAEITAPPFDRLVWPLGGYLSSQTHQLRVEVEDELGLRRGSIEAPVEVAVEELRLPWWKALAGVPPYWAALAGVLAGSALIFALALGVRRSRKPGRRDKDASSQPIFARAGFGLRRRGSQELTWPRALAHPDAPARLVRLAEGGNSIPAESVPLSRKEITFGCDPQLAVSVLASPSVAPLHARLYQDPEGRYILADNGSIAGTWVNYAPVSSLGVHLEHGDLVHIGRVAFRFELSNPETVRQPVVRPYAEDGDGL